MTVREEIEAEYARCLDLAVHPEKSRPLFDVEGLDAVKRYYAYRAEGIGFVLDRMK